MAKGRVVIALGVLMMQSVAVRENRTNCTDHKCPKEIKIGNVLKVPIGTCVEALIQRPDFSPEQKGALDM